MTLLRRILKSVYEETTRIGDELGVLNPDTIYRESWYADMASDKQLRKDADSIVSAIDTEFNPETVIDLGCGVGHYLRAFQDRNVSIHGVEGAEKAFNQLQIPVDKVEHYDLREPYSPPEEYELAICFEVAEHLPERSASTLVDSLADCAPQVLFTAATPGQGGTHHVNEQPREYWIQKFSDRGYTYEDETVQVLRTEMDVEKAMWIPENLFVFKSD